MASALLLRIALRMTPSEPPRPASAAGRAARSVKEQAAATITFFIIFLFSMCRSLS